MIVKDIVKDLKLIALKEKYVKNNLTFWLENLKTKNANGNTFYLSFDYSKKEDKKPFTQFFNEVLIDFFNAIRCDNDSTLLKIEISCVDYKFDYKFAATYDATNQRNIEFVSFNGFFQNQDIINGDDFNFFYDDPRECLCERVSESLFRVISENYLLGKIFQFFIFDGKLDVNKFFNEIKITLEFIDEFHSLDDNSTSCNKQSFCFVDNKIRNETN